MMGCVWRALVILTALTILPDTARSASVVPPEVGSPVFLPGAAVTNPRFPLLPGTTAQFRAQSIVRGEQLVQEFDRTVLFERRVIAGVDAVVVRDRSFQNGRLVTVNLDFYAQDAAGNVWRLGEDVTRYVYDRRGKLLRMNRDGGWRTGVNGALPRRAVAPELAPMIQDDEDFTPSEDALDDAQRLVDGPRRAG